MSQQEDGKQTIHTFIVCYDTDLLYINHVDILSRDNMREVLDTFWDCRAKWKLIGIELGMDIGTLDAIDKDNNKVEDSLVDMIKQWLRGKPTRRTMTMALKARCVTGGVTSVQGID